MSVLAYRTYPNKSDTFTFDVWHDEKLMEFLNKEMNFYMGLDMYGTGIVDIPVLLLEKVIVLREESELDEDTINQIKLDISDGQSCLGEVVSYYCF